MKKYWKLLNIEDGEYSVHETEEEVNHIIEYRTRDFGDDKVTERINIETPFSNYDFQFVYVFDEHHIHQFVYFYDTIEEERDDFEERVQILQTHRDTDIDEKQREFEDAYEAMRTNLIEEILSVKKENYRLQEFIDDADICAILKAQFKLDEHAYCDSDIVRMQAHLKKARARIKELESALEHAECFVTGHKDEAETLKEENERLVSELSKANNIINFQRERINDLQENLNKIRDAAFPF